jgi:hypothetical protein
MISQMIPQDYLFGLELVINSPLFAAIIKVFDDMIFI